MLFETTPRQKQSYLQFFEGFEEDEGEPFTEPKDALTEESPPLNTTTTTTTTTNKRSAEETSTEEGPSTKKQRSDETSTDDPPASGKRKSDDSSTDDAAPTAKSRKVDKTSSEAVLPTKKRQWIAHNGKGRRTLRIVNKQVQDYFCSLSHAFLQFDSLLPSNLEIGVRIYLTSYEKYFTTSKPTQRPTFKILDAKLLVEFILLKPNLLKAMETRLARSFLQINFLAKFVKSYR